MDWEKYFEMMIDWKKLPAYKAEPRIDSLVGYYLKPFLSDHLKTKIIGIIPEFPLRLGTIQPKHEGTAYADRSYKVDFLGIEDNGKNYLIEFKTDNSSLRGKQNDYLVDAEKLGTQTLIDAAVRISKVSSYKEKYGHLISRMQEFGLLDSKLKYTGKNPNFEIIFIIPARKDMKQLTLDFQDIANWFETTGGMDSFEKYFKGALQQWYREALPPK